MEKVFFDLDVIDDYPPVARESVWAEKLASGAFKIRNIPFYTKDASLDDEVNVSLGQDGEFVFEQVIAASDNSTVRIIFLDDGVTQIGQIKNSLEGLGCGWEGMGERFFSINVPIETSLDDVLSILETCAEKGWLDYEYGMLRQ